MATYAGLLSTHGVELPAHLEAQAKIPLLTGAQRQGDLIVLPTSSVQPPPAADPHRIPPDGVPVVRGEATANTHLLVGDGTWAPCEAVPDLGVVAVATEAYLLHPEHGAQGLAAGSYLLRRQREQAVGRTRIIRD